MGLTLYHWTCHHSYTALGDRGKLLSGKHFISALEAYASLPVASQYAIGVVWLTDIALPSQLAREQLGLTSRYVDCDRMQYRYRVVNPLVSGVVPWSAMRQYWPVGVIRNLESVEGVDPSRWWCSPGPVRVEYSPVPIGVVS